MHREDLLHLIWDAGFRPVERNTRYQIVREYDAPPSLAELRAEPVPAWWGGAPPGLGQVGSRAGARVVGWRTAVTASDATLGRDMAERTPAQVFPRRDAQGRVISLAELVFAALGGAAVGLVLLAA